MNLSKMYLLTDCGLFLDVAESLLEADFLRSFSEDLIRIAERDFFGSAILNCVSRCCYATKLSTSLCARGGKADGGGLSGVSQR